MKLFKYLLPVAMACGVVSVHAYDYSGVDEMNYRDFTRVAEFLQTKREGALEDKMSNLNLSGDVRFQFRQLSQKENGRQANGDNDLSKNDDRGEERSSPSESGAYKYPNTFWDVEFNLIADYRTCNMWAVGHLEFDNKAGVFDHDDKDYSSDDLWGSGDDRRIALRRAYIGYNFWDDECSRFDMELGRQKLYDIFDSKVQYQSYFDGLVLKYSRMLDWAHGYVNAGAFVVDSVSDHYGFVVEAGLLSICDMGFDLKYSYTHWDKDGRNRKRVKDAKGNDYEISQLTGYYHFRPDCYDKDVTLYAAFLHNHDAKKSIDGKEDFGWYAGATFGSIACAGDWYFDANYQWVEAGVVPDRDMGGITRGTQTENSCKNYCPKDGDNYGLGNYKGIELQGGYAITNNWLIKALYQTSRVINKDLGFEGKNSYSKFQVTSVYAF